MRHIIVEGPDGAGKTTLITGLSSWLQMPVHEKASDSKTGPVDSLFKWVDNDMAVLRTPAKKSFIYDRHPAISEPIYGHEVRGHTQYPFANEPSLRGLRAVMYDTCLVVWCLPDLATVSANVQASLSNQMSGVPANIGRVHQAYMTAYFRWRGPKRRYDYNHKEAVGLTEEIRRMINA